MTGYIILAAFIVLAVSHSAVFFTGYSHARKRAEFEHAEDERRRLQSNLEFQKEKEDIQKEVFSDAEQKKASLSAGTSGRDRFDAINNSLRNSAQKIEYIRDVPSVVFPVFPPPDCVEYDEAVDAVYMPLWYWQKIAEYKIDVDAAAEYLSRLKDATGGMRDQND